MNVVAHAEEDVAVHTKEHVRQGHKDIRLQKLLLVLIDIIQHSNRAVLIVMLHVTALLYKTAIFLPIKLDLSLLLKTMMEK
jgi:hypothetical protein